MVQKIRNILVVRILQNMAIAVSTQNVNITAYDYGSEPIQLTPENIQGKLNSLSRQFPNRSFISRFKDIFVFTRIINRNKPDVIHVNALQDLIYVYLAVKMSARTSQRPAIIAMSHNPNTWSNNAWFKAKYVNLFCNGFVALSTLHKDLLIKYGLSPRKITVIPNPYDPIQLTFKNLSIQEKPDKPKDHYKVIYIANICKRKAQDILVNAAIEVQNKYPEIKFEFIGKIVQGEEEFAERLKLLIKKNKKEESIVLVGEIPYKDVSTALQECNIFVFPTWAEMMPRAVIEAMVFGKPVIASGVDGILDLIQNRKTGILVQPGNISELAAAVIELIENPQLARTLGKAGQEYILEYCSPERVGIEFCNYYQYILNNQGLNN